VPAGTTGHLSHLLIGEGGFLRTLRLELETIPIDVRLLRINRRWLASTDTPQGPTLGCAKDALAALYLALDPFQPAIEPLLDRLAAVVEVGDE
jgi:hypothetical protein